MDTPAAGDPPSQLARDTEAPSPAATAEAAEQPLPTAEADTQVLPEPIDEAAEEQAAAAEAAAIGGSAGNEYAGSEYGEPASESERPLAEAGEGVAEGQEQAEAELEENAGPGDEGVSDAERQIEDAIEAADNPAVGRDARAGRPGLRGLLGRRRRHLRRGLEDLVGRRGQAAVSGRRLGRSPNNRRNPHVGLKGCALRSDGVGASPRTRPPKEQVPACPAPSVSSCCWQAPAPPSP